MEARRRRQTNRESLSQATERAASRVRQLRSRIDRPADADTGGRDDESVDEMERQLQEIFERTSGKTMADAKHLNDLRGRVVDGVVERILREWESAGNQGKLIEDEVVAQLIARVMERLESATASEETAGSQLT